MKKARKMIGTKKEFLLRPPVSYGLFEACCLILRRKQTFFCNLDLRMEVTKNIFDAASSIIYVFLGLLSHFKKKKLFRDFNVFITLTLKWRTRKMNFCWRLRHHMDILRPHFQNKTDFFVVLTFMTLTFKWRSRKWFFVEASNCLFDASRLNFRRKQGFFMILTFFITLTCKWWPRKIVKGNPL